jgi:hypothetical protein
LNVEDERLEAEISDLQQQRDVADRWIRALGGQLASAQEKINTLTKAVVFAQDVYGDIGSNTEDKRVKAACTTAIASLRKVLDTIDRRQ